MEMDKVLKQADYVSLGFMDLQGQLRGDVISTKAFKKDKHVLKDVEQKKPFSVKTLADFEPTDGSSYGHFSPIYDSELFIKIDPELAYMDPRFNEDGKPKIGMLFGRLYDLRGERFISDPCRMLEDTIGRTKLNIKSSSEHEFFILPIGKDGKPDLTINDGEGYWSLNIPEMMIEAIKLIEKCELPFERLSHEVAPNQYEITLTYDDALKSAYNSTIAWRAIRYTAKKFGFFATRLPKLPGFYNDENGSGSHYNWSLWNDEKNIMGDNGKLSEKGKQAFAGVLQHIPEFAVGLTQLVNSFKRLVPHKEAPTHICWGVGNRSVSLRQGILGNKGELRTADASVHPMLISAFVLEAANKGIEKKLQLPKAADFDVFKVVQQGDDNIIKECKIKTYPESLEEAIKLAREKGSVFRSVVTGINKKTGKQIADLLLDDMKKHNDGFGFEGEPERTEKGSIKVNMEELEHTLSIGL